ncbi:MULTISPECIES: hypothetical protein [Vibrio]|jgi:hypothetical protein|uniref:Orphan protein n=1 Tax=Vibrio splendidus TaxID=29497 RepID=A0A0P6ZB14_VIBSP|nr:MULTISPECIES: hypothetical protein [Vibrio]HAH02625.1 hypothetical protein [Vibrio sp.]EAP94475.1 putative orphan protein; putative membrane protein [Vibrio splendidus 12B01]KPL94974.1 hypothetical protein AN168_10725 [Vibrio splendidus]KPL97591.1 hypothetical protein AN167_22085 [Vibrio splendidus]MBB1462666.1 hypothetical protein [Vibrio sp. SG41-7]
MKTMTQRFQTLLSVSNFSLATTALLMLLSIIVAYPMADHFSLPIQIVAHISTILVAALLKISYVGRCLAQYNLGLEVR